MCECGRGEGRCFEGAGVRDGVEGERC
jgi:hypothetical protein